MNTYNADKSIQKWITDRDCIDTIYYVQMVMIFHSIKNKSIVYNEYCNAVMMSVRTQSIDSLENNLRHDSIQHYSFHTIVTLIILHWSIFSPMTKWKKLFTHAYITQWPGLKINSVSENMLFFNGYETVSNCILLYSYKWLKICFIHIST